MNASLRYGLQIVGLFAPIAIVFAVGNRVLLPGIDPDFLARQASSDLGSAIERLSILALGLTPVLNGLAIGEIARLFFQWQPAAIHAERATAPWTTILTRLIVLAVAGLQGYGIASGLLAAGAFAPDTPAAISIIVSTIVGATAVLLWLSDQIKLRGLRHGLWLLWSATFFFSLPAELAIAAEETKVGAMSLVHWLVNVAYVFCALAAVVAVNHSWIKRIEGLAPQPSPHSVDTLSIFVWPIFLASMVGGYVLTIVIVLIQEAWQPSQLMLKAVATLIIVFLIPVFVLGYAKLHLKAIPPSPGTASSVYRGAAIVAGLEVALFLTGSFVGYFFDLPLTPNGILFIVVGTIFTAVARNHRTLHRGAVVGFAEP